MVVNSGRVGRLEQLRIMLPDADLDQHLVDRLSSAMGIHAVCLERPPFPGHINITGDRVELGSWNPEQTLTWDGGGEEFFFLWNPSRTKIAFNWFLAHDDGAITWEPLTPRFRHWEGVYDYWWNIWGGRTWGYRGGVGQGSHRP